MNTFCHPLDTPLTPPGHPLNVEVIFEMSIREDHTRRGGASEEALRKNTSSSSAPPVVAFGHSLRGHTHSASLEELVPPASEMVEGLA
jgi:hypothetical protein